MRSGPGRGRRDTGGHLRRRSPSRTPSANEPDPSGPDARGAGVGGAREDRSVGATLGQQTADNGSHHVGQIDEMDESRFVGGIGQPRSPARSDVPIPRRQSHARTRATPPEDTLSSIRRSAWSAGAPCTAATPAQPPVSIRSTVLLSHARPASARTNAFGLPSRRPRLPRAGVRAPAGGRRVDGLHPRRCRPGLHPAQPVTGSFVLTGTGIGASPGRDLPPAFGSAGISAIILAARLMAWRMR